MRQALVSASQRMWRPFGRFLRRVFVPPKPPILPSPIASAPPASDTLTNIERIVLTDGVSSTLFDQYAEHRAGTRGEEETGWILMGHRREREAIALATLPAGAGREAGVAHVRFNSNAQAVASRILRQEDRQLAILGVVHTHPGSLRHPSAGDLEGDRHWVKLLRGGEGVFAIGTLDKKMEERGLAGVQPKPHIQCFRGLRFDWYALAADEWDYRPLHVTLTNGPDLARPLHSVWATVERHAERLENLQRRLLKVRLEARMDETDSSLQVSVPLQGKESIRVLLRGEDVRYCLICKDQVLTADHPEPRVDVGVFQMLAELAKG